MTRNVKLAFLAAVAMAAPACIGGYAPGQDGTPPVDNSTPPVNQNTGGASGTGGGGAGGGGGGGGGSGGTGATAPSSARTMFEPAVATIITAKCSNTACHGGTGSAPTKFAVGTATTMYDNILGYSSRVLGDFDKTTATILSKIAAGNHNATTYTAAEVKSIGDWLDAERTARAAAGTTNTPSARELLLQKWSGCMVKTTEFDAFATAWAQKTTDTNNTACQQCHVNGQGFWANNDPLRSFNVLTTAKNPAGGWFMEMYFTVDMTTDPANPKIIINRDFMTRAALGTAQHEKFQLDTDRNGGTPTAMAKLKTYYDSTMLKVLADKTTPCGPSRLGTTPP
ncbi:MAG: hypothetical protein JWN44_2335 [Myxococcales bacterium]|nr:hypothetical protein [Myxococcales bacterium]